MSRSDLYIGRLHADSINLGSLPDGPPNSVTLESVTFSNPTGTNMQMSTDSSAGDYSLRFPSAGPATANDLLAVDNPTTGQLKWIVPASSTLDVINSNTINNTNDINTSTLACTNTVTTPQMRLSSGGQTMTMQPSGPAGNISWTIPNTNGSSGYLLANDGAGVLSWQDPTTLSLSSNISVYLGGAQSSTPVLSPEIEKFTIAGPGGGSRGIGINLITGERDGTTFNQISIPSAGSYKLRVQMVVDKLTSGTNEAKWNMWLMGTTALTASFPANHPKSAYAGSLPYTAYHTHNSEANSCVPFVAEWHFITNTNTTIGVAWMMGNVINYLGYDQWNMQYSYSLFKEPFPGSAPA